MGDSLMIQCLASITDISDVSLLIFNWMAPGGDIIRNNSRVIISPTSSNGNNYTSNIQFTYLMEGDNGTYTCNVSVLAASGSESVELEALTGM